MKTMSATDFKATCLQVMDEVRRGGEPIGITKHGRLVVELHPPADIIRRRAKAGFMKDLFDVSGDLVQRTPASPGTLR